MLNGRNKVLLTVLNIHSVTRKPLVISRTDRHTCLVDGRDALPGGVRVCGGRGGAWRPPTLDTCRGQAWGAPSEALRATTTVGRNTCLPSAPATAPPPLAVCSPRVEGGAAPARTGSAHPRASLRPHTHTQGVPHTLVAKASKNNHYDLCFLPASRVPPLPPDR
ncbi:uncharacterized protein LOC123508964 [Portunus trituberculatus]|uniref:uncharacterized protein LOC123508964 n=1 Tax=Portunus trituberculatus TaxID=210409 RepID=UPI001E1D0EDF|nr:uncharacterized protein LOC123508964 [Portunus trituberculatus]